MKRRAGFLVAAAAVALAACQVIAGIDRVHKTEAGPVADGSVLPVADASDPCQHVVVPPPPPPNDDDNTQFYLAMKTLSLTQPAANGIAGVDLDGTCTCDKRAGTAHAGGPSCNPRSGGQVACDTLDGGIDNAGMSLFSTIFGAVKAQTGNDYEGSLNDDITSGARTLFFFIKGWNGKPNDSEVDVGIFISNGTAPDTTNNLPHTKPNFDGNDVWSYPSVVSDVNGQLTDTQTSPGYVSNGYLVVQNKEAVTIVFGTTGLPFGDSVVLGNLDVDAETNLKTFTGILGGRIKQSDLLGAAGQIAVGGGKYVCNDTEDGLPVYGIVQSFICPAADIMASYVNDYSQATCDSISATLAIYAVEAQIGYMEVNPPTTTTNPCTPGQPGAPSYTCP